MIVQDIGSAEGQVEGLTPQIAAARKELEDKDRLRKQIEVRETHRTLVITPEAPRHVAVHAAEPTTACVLWLFLLCRRILPTAGCCARSRSTTRR